MHVKWDGDGDEDPKTKLGSHEWIKFENNGVFGTLRSNPFLENVGYIHGSVLQDIYDYKRGITFHYGPGLGFQSKNFNGELTETLQSVIPTKASNVQEYVDRLTEMNHGQRSFNVDDFYNLLPEERVGYFAIEWEEMNNEWEEKLGVFDVRPGITGLAQLNGIDMSKPEILADIDAKMLETMSVRNYFLYVLLTLLGKGQRDGIKP